MNIFNGVSCGCQFGLVAVGLELSSLRRLPFVVLPNGAFVTVSFSRLE